MSFFDEISSAIEEVDAHNDAMSRARRNLVEARRLAAEGGVDDPFREQRIERVTAAEDHLRRLEERTWEEDRIFQTKRGLFAFLGTTAVVSAAIGAGLDHITTHLDGMLPPTRPLEIAVAAAVTFFSAKVTFDTGQILAEIIQPTDYQSTPQYEEPWG